MTRREFRDLADPAVAREAIADLDLEGGTESVPLGAARGRVLAERVDAPIDVPGFSRAAMDGYAARWLEDGISDVLVVDAGEPSAGDRLATIDREWGLVVPSGNPDDVGGIADLSDAVLRFANIDTDLALRGEFDDWLDASREGDGDPTEAIDGIERELPGVESPARSVARGNADVGLGLRATAASLGLDFLAIDT